MWRGKITSERSCVSAPKREEKFCKNFSLCGGVYKFVQVCKENTKIESFVFVRVRRELFLRAWVNFLYCV